MPVKVTYPGVYIQELPSGQHTITGAGTAITAFVGRALYGPVNDPVTIFSFGDYQHFFGGLAYDFPMSYAVQDFFLNGGSQALIVRLFEPPTKLSPSEWNTKADRVAKHIQEHVKNALSAKVETAAETAATDEKTAATDEKTAATDEKSAATDEKSAATATAAIEKVVKAVREMVSQYPDEPGKTVVKSLYDIASDGASKNGATPSSVQQAIDNAVTNINKIVPFPYPHARLTFDIYGDAIPVLKAALAPLKAAVDALFDDTGNAEAKAITKAKDPVSILTTAAQNAVLSVNGSANKRIAHTVAQQIKGQTPQQALDCAISHLSGTEKPKILLILPKLVYLSFTTILNDFQTKVLKHIFASDSMLSVASVYQDIQEIRNQAIQEAAKQALADKGTIKSLFDAVLDTLPVAAATISSTDFPKNQLLRLQAANPGAWGAKLTASVNTQGITDQVVEMYQDYGLTKDDLFNLTVTVKRPSGLIDTEQFTNVTVKRSGNPPNRLDRVLANQSQLVRVLDNNLSNLPTQTPPDGATAQISGGSNGTYLSVETYSGNQDAKIGIYALEHTQAFDIMCIPPDKRGESNTNPLVYTEALEYCFIRRSMLIVDPPYEWAGEVKQGNITQLSPSDPRLGVSGPKAINAVVYFPRVKKEDPKMKNQIELFSACGIIAGIYAATDARTGVWKAPAGLNAGISGIHSLNVHLTDEQNGVLNQVGINGLRNFPIVGPVVWGDLTLRGANILESDYKFVSVRRLTLYIEDSLYQGTKWAVFEPNDENLWSALRLSVGGFMEALSRQGAFYSFTVVCDKTTTTQRDINLGIVKILVQFAPVKPAEFVVIEIQQQAGQSAG